MPAKTGKELPKPEQLRQVKRQERLLGKTNQEEGKKSMHYQKTGSRQGKQMKDSKFFLRIMKRVSEFWRKLTGVHDLRQENVKIRQELKDTLQELKAYTKVDVNPNFRDREHHEVVLSGFYKKNHLLISM